MSVPATETPVAATAPATEQPAATSTTITDTPAITETKPTEPVTEPAAPVTSETPAPVKEEGKKEEKEATKPAAEPIYHGALHYQISGLSLKNFLPSKKYFWFGEEEAVPVSKLSSYLRGEKPSVSHPTAAWSSVTGKGLLYYVKHADQKETPAGVLNLADVTDIVESGNTDFHFKLHNQKHSFQTKAESERDGWLLAIRKVAKEAAEKKEEIQNNTSYKEQIEKLSKPAALAAVAPAKVDTTTPKKSTEAKKSAEPKKSTDKPLEGVTRDNASSSSSSSSSGEDKKAKRNKKSRSVSRGKRASIFNTLRGKKDEAAVKKDEKKAESEVKKEEKKEAHEEKKAEKKTEGASAPTAEAAAVTTAAAAPTTEKKEEPVPEAVKEEKKEEKKEETATPKFVKRGSIFGGLYEKIRSPTQEKKEVDFAPAVPAKDTPKDTETPVATEGTTSTEAAATEAAKEPIEAAAPTEPVKDDVKPVEAKPEAKTDAKATPSKEKKSFFDKFLGGASEKVKSPTSETTPATDKAITEPPAKTETSEPVAAPTAPAITEPVSESAVNGSEPTSATEPPKKERRSSSFFGSLKKPFPKAEKAEKPAEKTAEKPAETVAKTEEPAKETTATPTAITDAPAPTTATEIPKTETPKTETPKTDAKVDAKPEHKSTPSKSTSSKLGGILRNPSKLIRGNKEAKKETAPAKTENKIEEAAEPKKQEAVKEPAKPEETAKKTDEPATTNGQASIGDVVPEAVTVGQPQSSTPAVSAAA